MWWGWGLISPALSAAGSAIAGGYGTASTAVGAMGTNAGVAIDSAGRTLFGTPLTFSPTSVTLPQQGLIDTAVQGTKDFVMGPGGLVSKAQEIITNIVASRPL